MSLAILSQAALALGCSILGVWSLIDACVSRNRRDLIVGSGLLGGGLIIGLMLA